MLEDFELLIVGGEIFLRLILTDNALSRIWSLRPSRAAVALRAGTAHIWSANKERNHT